ncbi:Biosynthetic Aromatic amino acid aminotransferase beta @ Histidinol-phosphate aminotransferase [uncultured Candidatus Thioglobus sp.]|nr:Biosynthetic Aromatic amino acid aminotransferase beta @ Histidinol-phosphate aminotransferase [uncultured Candidatus Thioglobus sp.]
MNISPAIKSLNPYQGGKPISELKRELGLDEVVKLASNENPNPLSDKVKAAIIAQLDEIGRYPDGNGFELKQALSDFLGCEQTQITLGNGSNDILELLARLFVCDASDEVIFSQYSFVVYPLATQALGAKAVVVPSVDFGHNLEAMALAITDKTKLIFIANPNNPTGTYLSDEAILAFMDKVPSAIPVVLDQAYFEYTASKIGVEMIEKYPNLIITRTFSKAYGLAGLRVGYSISSVEIADYINRLRQPFNVNHIAQTAAIAALADEDFLQKSILSNRQGLRQLANGFEALGLSSIASSANFVAVKVTDANAVYQQLLQKGFIVRPVEMPNYLRVTVGTKTENTSFLEALKLTL